MKTLENFWDQRSQQYGDKVEGVMLKSVPSPINDYLHQWMTQQISRQIASREEIQILDIGCGYGRLSRALLKEFPKIKTSGIDIASKYVELYNQYLYPRGKAFKGDIRKLSFQDSTFDMVFIVTTLMYLAHQQDQKQAFKEIYRVLKPGGRVVIIERNPSGFSIFNLGGLVTLLRGRKHSEIPAVSFTPDQMFQLMKEVGLKSREKQGIPIFTLFFYPIFLTHLINKHLGRILLKLINYSDKICSGWIKPSLYIVYSGVKDET